MSSCSPITLIWFQATHIMVTEELPVSAFGQRVPVLPEQDFSLPWMWSFLNFRWIRESKSQHQSFFRSKVERRQSAKKSNLETRAESVFEEEVEKMKEQCCQMARAGGRKIQVRRPKSYFPELFGVFQQTKDLLSCPEVTTVLKFRLVWCFYQLTFLPRSWNQSVEPDTSPRLPHVSTKAFTFISQTPVPHFLFPIERSH